jgi:hypothetical protein
MGKVFDKSMIEVAESKEGLNLFDCMRSRPCSDSCKFGKVHLDLTIVDDNSKVFN